MDGGSSLEIVARIREGDASAWEELYARFRDRLLFSIRCRMGARLRAKLDSEDVLQSVVKDALRDLPRFEAEGEGALSHWLHVCALNKIRAKADWFGAAKRAGDVPLTDSQAERLCDPAGAAAALSYRDAARYERLEQAVANLPDKLREVVLLRQIEGLSNGEAAAALGKSEEATSKLHARALRRLGETLRGAEPGP